VVLSQLPTLVTLFINGKFTLQPCTGVQRVARNLLCALDTRLAGLAGLAAAQHRQTARAVLLLPHGASAPTLRHIETLVVGHRAMPLHWWEQCQLPLAARGGLLLNLSGSAPLLARRQVCMLHDAAVFDHAASYTAAFRYWYQALFWLLARRETRLLTVSAFSRLRLSQRLASPPIAWVSSTLAANTCGTFGLTTASWRASGCCLGGISWRWAAPTRTRT
jgi:hypothetical protein